MYTGACYIAGAGDYHDGLPPAPGDFLIAADAGYAQLTRRGHMPDLVVGDFDSLSQIPEHPNIIRHSAAKDDTDMLLAVKLGLERGFKTFYLNGGMGGRLDHTLANIQTLIHIARSGTRGYLFSDYVNITAISAATLSFTPAASGTVSVFCFGEDAVGVDLKGLKYPLRDATLTCAHPLGVSNEFTGVPASISVRSGSLVVMWSGALKKTIVI